jgi:hypothetical protein
VRLFSLCASSRMSACTGTQHMHSGSIPETLSSWGHYSSMSSRRDSRVLTTTPPAAQMGFSKPEHQRTARNQTASMLCGQPYAAPAASVPAAGAAPHRIAELLELCLVLEHSLIAGQQHVKARAQHLQGRPRHAAAAQHNNGESGTVTRTSHQLRSPAAVLPTYRAVTAPAEHVLLQAVCGTSPS